MAIFDWWGAMGTVIQSFFAWTTFNAGQFNANVGWRQNQQYQKKNYSIAWIAVARDDIRDMMSISVNRINNYMVVATLILSVAGSAVVSFDMDAKVPPHVVYSVYICTGSSVTFLMLSILFGVKGQNTAFTRTMKLLTFQMRPEPSAEYSHNYMQQSQWLERGGLPTMFRFPGMYPVKEMDAGMPKRSRSSNAALAEQMSASQASDLIQTDSAANVEDDTPLEALEIRSNQTTYLAKFANFMQFWLPYDVYAKYTMGMGVIALGQGSAYFALSELVATGKFLVAVPMICLSSTFLITVVIVIQQNYHSERKWTRPAAIVAACAGNIFATISTINREYYIIDAVCVPLSYLSHAVFYGLAPCVGQKGRDGYRGSAGNPFDFGTHFMANSEEDDDEEVKRALDGTPDGPTLSGGGLGDPEDNWEDEEMEESALLSKAEKGAGGIPGTRDSKAQLRKSRRRLEDKVPFHPVHNDEFGPSGDWGMTQRRYKADKDRTEHGVVRTVRCTLVLIAMIWLTMFIWSTLSAVFPQTMKADYLFTTDHWEELPVVWPNPMFRATRLACAEGAVYVSDSHNLFEMIGRVDESQSLHLRRAKCEHFDPIIDIAVDCIGAVCYPLVLVRRPSGELQVVNCSSGKSQGLQLDGFEPTMFYVWPLLNSSEEEAGSSTASLADAAMTTSLAAPLSSMAADESKPSSQLATTTATTGTFGASSTKASHAKIDDILSSGRRRLESLDDDANTVSDMNTSDDDGRRRMLAASGDGSVLQAVLEEDDGQVGEASRTWSSEWPLGVIGDPQRMVDLGASGGVVVVFRRHFSNQDQYLSLNHFMAVYNRTTMRLLSRWAPLYKTMNSVLAGCAVYEGTQALVLIGETDELHGSNPPRLVMMSLDASEPYKRWIHIQ